MVASNKQVATSVSKCWVAVVLKVVCGVGKLELLLQIITFKNAS